MQKLSFLKADLPNIVTHPHLSTVYESWIVNDSYSVFLSITNNFKHIRIRRLDNLPIVEYKLFQVLKNHFWGDDTVAVQVFPKQTDYIDNSNTYHLFTWDNIDVPNLKHLYKYNK